MMVSRIGCRCLIWKQLTANPCRNGGISWSLAKWFSSFANCRNQPRNLVSFKANRLSTQCARLQKDDNDDGNKSIKKLKDDPEVRKILDQVIKDFEKEDKEKKRDEKTTNDDNVTVIAPSLADRFRPFSDEDASVILDVHELENLQRYKYQKDDDEDDQEFYSIYHERHRSPLEGATLERGVTGVFDIEELVEVLQKENAQDICVIDVPSEFHYADYMVIVSARSPRHTLALAEFMRKMYKKKKHDSDRFIYPDGKETDDWHVLDMQNIVLHIFQESTREKYDLEMLWTVGPEYDDMMQRPLVDPVQQMLLDTFEWEITQPTTR